MGLLKDLLQNIKLLSTVEHNQVIATHTPVDGFHSEICTNIASKNEGVVNIICRWANKPEHSKIDCICATFPYGIIETDSKLICEDSHNLHTEIDGFLSRDLTSDVDTLPMKGTDKLDVTPLPPTGQPHNQYETQSNPIGFWTQLMSAVGLEQKSTQYREFEHLTKRLKKELVEEITHNATNLTKSLCSLNSTKIVRILKDLKEEYEE